MGTGLVGVFRPDTLASRADKSLFRSGSCGSLPSSLRVLGRKKKKSREMGHVSRVGSRESGVPVGPYLGAGQ